MVNRMTTVYKIVTGKVEIPKDYFFKVANTKTRAKHHLKLQTYKPRSDIDKFAFAQRSVPEWNNLPAHIINASSAESFKSLLIKYLKRTPASD